MLRWYQSQLARRPILTQSIASAILFGAGDVLAQHIVEKRGAARHDPWRTVRMACYGGAIFGPGATIWYRTLQRINLRSKPLTLVTRVGLDQVVFTSVNMLLFLSSMAFFEGYPAPKGPAAAEVQPAKERIRDRLSSTYYTAVTRNWMVWPWVQVINFSVVPLEHRVLVVNVVALGWNCYLSYLNSKGAAAQGRDKAQEKEDS